MQSLLNTVMTPMPMQALISEMLGAGNVEGQVKICQAMLGLRIIQGYVGTICGSYRVIIQGRYNAQSWDSW